MANPTKSSLIGELQTAFDNVTGSGSTLTDQEFKDCMNAALSTFETLDPVKGVPTVKY